MFDFDSEFTVHTHTHTHFVLFTLQVLMLHSGDVLVNASYL